MLHRTRLAKTFLLVVVLALCSYLFYYSLKKGAQSPTNAFMEKKFSKEAQILKDLKFSLVDPAEAPAEIRALVLKGYNIVIRTQKNAPKYAGNRLNCTNCHFAGGDTLGGTQSGIPLVGVAAKYPRYAKGFHRVIDLEDRINNCFTRSMDGNAVPRDSEEMLALITYFHWISKDIPIYGKTPWLGLPDIKSTHQGDIQKGKQLYTTYCAICHREDGQGGSDQEPHGVNIPPVWGKDSFNDSAGFNDVSTLASFIHLNMPYFDSTPVLNEEQALDVAAYIISQPRPKRGADDKSQEP